MTLKSNSKLHGLGIILSAYMMTACSTTPDDTYNNQLLNNRTIEPLLRVDFECEQQVKQREAALPPNAQPGAYMALANHAKRCIDGIQFNPKHPDNQTAMQFTALAVLNYLKAGELVTAQQTLAEFRQRFPQQDLLLADYTSFVDTATALLQSKSMSKRDVSLLNINPTLRAELARQQHWSAN